MEPQYGFRSEQETDMKLNISKMKCLFNNEDGSVLFVALIVLILFTLLGVSSTTTSTIGMHIVGNENLYKQNLYLAEGAAMESARNLKDADLRYNPPGWLLPTVGSVADSITQESFRADNGESSIALTDESGSPRAHRMAAFEGAAGSLDMTKSRVYAYTVYGWSNLNGRLVIVEVGYRKSFK